MRGTNIGSAATKKYLYLAWSSEAPSSASRNPRFSPPNDSVLFSNRGPVSPTDDPSESASESPPNNIPTSLMPEYFKIPPLAPTQRCCRLFSYMALKIHPLPPPPLVQLRGRTGRGTGGEDTATRRRA
eukprot:1612794-Rhodomonas_salina.1